MQFGDIMFQLEGDGLPGQPDDYIHFTAPEPRSILGLLAGFGMILIRRKKRR